MNKKIAKYRKNIKIGKKITNNKINFIGIILIFFIAIILFSFGYFIGHKNFNSSLNIVKQEEKKDFKGNTLIPDSSKIKNSVDIESMILHHEGKKNEVYKDPAGNVVAGVGHLLNVGVPVCNEVVQYWLQKDIQQAELDANNIELAYNMKLDPIRHAALIDLAYQLGWSKLNQLKTMLCAMRDKRWKDAEIAFSKTTMAQKFKQLRIDTLRKMIRDGSIEGTDLEKALLNKNKE